MIGEHPRRNSSPTSSGFRTIVIPMLTPPFLVSHATGTLLCGEGLRESPRSLAEFPQAALADVSTIPDVPHSLQVDSSEVGGAFADVMLAISLNWSLFEIDGYGIVENITHSSGPKTHVLVVNGVTDAKLELAGHPYVAPTC